MTLNLSMPGHDELKPRITVFGVGGAGGNAVNNMIEKQLDGVDFVVANTDAHAPRLGPPLPKKALSRSSIIWRGRTCASSPPGWAAAPAPGRLRSSRRPRASWAC